MLLTMGQFDPYVRDLVEMRYLLAKFFISDDAALWELLCGVCKTLHEEGSGRRAPRAATPRR